MIQNSLCAFMGTASHPCVGQEMKSKSHHLSGGLKAFVGRVPEKFLSLFIMINDHGRGAVGIHCESTGVRSLLYHSLKGEYCRFISSSSNFSVCTGRKHDVVDT